MSNGGERKRPGGSYTPPPKKLQHTEQSGQAQSEKELPEYPPDDPSAALLTPHVADPSDPQESVPANHNEPQPSGSCGSVEELDEQTERLLGRDDSPISAMLETASVPCWCKENPNEQGIVQLSPKYSNLINNNLVNLTKNIHMPSLWVYLRQFGVIDVIQEQELQAITTNNRQVKALLDCSQRWPTWKLHAIFKALVETCQDHVLTKILHLRLSDYQEQPAGEQPGQWENVDGAPGQPLKPELQKAIRSHKDVYIRTLMKGQLLDLEDKDVYDMIKCHIEILASSDERTTQSNEIDNDKILQVEPGEPQLKTAILTGVPGGGKSTFVRYITYRWAKGDGHLEYDIIVILNVSTIKVPSNIPSRDQINDAIRQSLKGNDNHKDAIMEALYTDNFQVLIIPDGLDECRIEVVKEMLTSLITQSHNAELPFTVLATSRTGLSEVKDKLFDRRLKIPGFTHEQGIDYVKTYYREINLPFDTSYMTYIEEHAESLNHILTNPLLTHILSVVTADGTLVLVEGKTLGQYDLLQAYEESLIKRQSEKSQEQNYPTEKRMNLNEQRKLFRSASLYGLMTDQRTFDQDFLAKFKIHPRSPYFTFMKKIQETAMKISAWSFMHEIFYEYMATRALKDLPADVISHFLITLCQNKKFRNMQKILFGALGKVSEHLTTLSDMIRATLLLQYNATGKDQIECLKMISDKIKQIVKQRDPLTVLLPGHEKGAKRKGASEQVTAQEIWHLIHKVYDERTAQVSLYDILDPHVHKDLWQHIYECLSELSMELQHQVFSTSIACLLPSTKVYENRYAKTLYATGGLSVSRIKHGTNSGFWIGVRSRQSMYEARRMVTKVEAPNPRSAREAIQQHIPDEHRDRTHQSDVSSSPRSSIQLQIRDDVLLPQGHSSRGPLTGEAWTELLAVLSKINTFKDLTVSQVGPDTFNVKGLLDSFLQPDTQIHLRDLLVPELKGHRYVYIYGGHFNADEICEWVSQYSKQSIVIVQLNNMTCRLTKKEKSTRDNERKAVRALKKTKHGEQDLFLEQRLKIIEEW